MPSSRSPPSIMHFLKSTLKKQEVFQVCYPRSWNRRASFVARSSKPDHFNISSDLTFSIRMSYHTPGCVQRIWTPLWWPTWRTLWASPSLTSHTRSPTTGLLPSWPAIICCSTSSAGAWKEPRPTRFLHLIIKASHLQKTTKLIATQPYFDCYL